MKKMFVFALLVAGISAANAQQPATKTDKAEKKEVKADAKPTEKKATAKATKGEKKETKAAQTGK